MSRSIEPKQNIYTIGYRFFKPLGELIMKLYKDLPNDLGKADIRVYPLAYASAVAMLTITMAALMVSINLILYVAFGIVHPLLIILCIIIPIITFVLGVLAPVVWKYNRIKSLENETPFAAAYISVMSTGGITPFRSMKRLSQAKLLPNLAKVSKYIVFDVSLFGIDPLTAMDRAADNVPAKSYAELIKGYVSTVRTGGDFVHYLLRKTELMFNERIGQLRVIGEKLGMMMEGYIAVTVLLGLGIYAIYITNVAMPVPMPMFGQASFFLFTYILTPMISILFLYLGDMMQPSYPESDWTIYKIWMAGLIPGIVVILISVVIPTFPVRTAVEKLVIDILGLGSGTVLPTLIGLILIISSIPGAWASIKHERKKRETERNLAFFLRDLVEIRKAGLPPEKCIANLKNRDYGILSPLIKRLSAQIEWGIPVRKILQDFSNSVNSWLAKMMMFLLIDAVDIGGGTPRTMEAMASYTEMMNEVEKQKREQLKPLLIVPYIGALVLVVSTVILLGFMKGVLSIARMGIAYETFLQMFTTPLVINVYLMGLVSGKVGEEKVSAGIKHALLLTLISVVALWITPSITISFAPVG